MVSRDPSSSPITKPHGVERGQDSARRWQDSAWSGQDWADLGWGQDSRMRGPTHTPRGQRAQRAPPSYLPPPRPQHEATAGRGPFQHKRRRVRAGKPTLCEPGPGCRSHSSPHHGGLSPWNTPHGPLSQAWWACSPLQDGLRPRHRVTREKETKGLPGKAFLTNQGCYGAWM